MPKSQVLALLVSILGLKVADALTENHIMQLEVSSRSSLASPASLVRRQSGSRAAFQIDAASEAPIEPAATAAAATEAPTEAATEAPTEAATEAPTEAPTEAATEAPTPAPPSYSDEVMLDKPVGHWSMEHETIISAGDAAAFPLCEAEPEGGISETAERRASRVPKSKYAAEGRACGQPNGQLFGDPCNIDAITCSTSSSWTSNLVDGLTSEAGANATKFDGEEYIRIPDHHMINTNATGYPQRTVELWFKAETADDVWRVIYAEGSHHDTGLSMYVRQDQLTGDKLHLKMFAWDRGAHDEEFGMLTVDQSIEPKPIYCEIEMGTTYYAVLEFDGPARTLTGYIREPHTNGTEPIICGREDQYPVGAKIGYHGNGVGNAVIGGIPSCPLLQVVCPSSRGDGTSGGEIQRRELSDGSAAAHNFNGIIDEVAIYNHILSKDDMKRHLCAGGDTQMCT